MTVFKELKIGYTTGSCAAAASQAAVEKLISGKKLEQVILDLPDGGQIDVPIQNIYLHDGQATAEVLKDAGDDPDVTHGISVLATVELLDSRQIIIEGGFGVGRVTKPGLAIPVGEAAINPAPRKMIHSALQKVLPTGRGARVVISIPDGEKLAHRTMNPRLGIVGGISVLGTAGTVRPMSDEAYLASLIPQIDQAVAMGHQILVLTPGAMGARLAHEKGIAEDAIIQCSNFIGIMLEQCACKSVNGVLLLGHIGKLIKVAAGIFNTHSKIADARRETLAAHAALMGAPADIIKAIMELNTMEESLELLKKHQLQQVYYSIAQSCSRRCIELLAADIAIGTVLYSLNGEFIAYDHKALELWRKLTCQEK